MNLKEEILQKTNHGLEVFCFYMPIEFVPKRNFRNPLYDDKRASCNIYFDAKSQCYRMKDFGNEAYSGDCFWFAATILGLDVRTEFRKLLATIIHDLGLNISVEKVDVSENRRISPKISSPIIRKAAVSEIPENKRWFRIYEQPFSAEEKAYWLRYGITDKTLAQYNVKSLFRYEAISNQGKPYTLTSTKEEPMFCYMMGDFVKIYRPKSKLRFLYGGEKTEDYIFGFEQLPNKGDVLFITGGEKTCCRCPHIISMPFVSTVKRLQYRRMSLKVCNSASGILFFSLTRTRQGCVKRNGKWNCWQSTMCYT